MGANDLRTDRERIFPWMGEAPSMEVAWHLTVVWFHDEPERMGQTAAIDPEGAWLGRSDEAGVGEPGQRYARFSEQRPGVTRPMPPIATPTMSRRQLRLQPIDDEFLQVSSWAEAPLYHGVREVEECRARAGDTVTVENVAMFFVERRPLVLVPLLVHPPPDFPFGHADPFGMVGETPAMWELRDRLAMVARADGHVLILGETGVGKELAARAVHGLSRRRDARLVQRSAVTITESLANAELFGNPRDFPNVGSPERRGMIAEANGGHLQLDEFGDMPLGLQARLLRVLDEGGQYQRVGEAIERHSDFRAIGCTNRGPEELKHDVLPRFDFQVVVPPLDAHRADVPLLLRHRLAYIIGQDVSLVQRFLRDGDPGRAVIEPWLVERLVRQHHPQNIRGLNLAIGAAVSTSPGAYLACTPAVLQVLETATTAAAATAPRSRDVPTPTPASPGGAALSREAIEAALRATDHHQTRAAEYLGIDRNALTRAMKRLKMK